MLLDRASEEHLLMQHDTSAVIAHYLNVHQNVLNAAVECQSAAVRALPLCKLVDIRKAMHGLSTMAKAILKEVESMPTLQMKLDELLVFHTSCDPYVDTNLDESESDSEFSDNDE
jgi:hypothetical protein